MTIKQAAKYLGVSTATLRRWDKAGILVPARNGINGYRIYSVSDLDKIKKKCGYYDKTMLQVCRETIASWLYF